jgi:hypothetical protein
MKLECLTKSKKKQNNDSSEEIRSLTLLEISESISNIDILSCSKSDEVYKIADHVVCTLPKISPVEYEQEYAKFIILV